MSRIPDVSLRPLGPADLARTNAVIEAAIMTWALPDRVKRLTLPSYRYAEHDLDHLTLVGAESAAGRIVAVAAWEPADPDDTPDRREALLLHGLYVAPQAQGRGIGGRLLGTALQAARAAGFQGLLVKASRDGQGFFAHQGMQRLPVVDQQRDYPYRFWRDTESD